MTPSSSSFVGAVATPHTLATEAAEAVLREGGSAVDAAITAAAVLSVVYPHNVSIGGDLVALLRMADGTTICINASGSAPAAQTAERLRTLYGGSLPIAGVDTITAPGAIAGWQALHSRGARLPWARYFEEAIQHAEHGVPVAKDLATNLTIDADLLSGDPGASAIFFRNGRPLLAGEAVTQTALAQTLCRIRDQGAAEFYTGLTARLLIEGLATRGGVLTADDLALVKAEITEPLRADFAGHEVLTSPPNTQGFVLIRILRSLAERGPLSHALRSEAGATARIFLEGNTVRDAMLSDPTFSGIDAEQLLTVDAGTLRERSTPTDSGYERPRGDTVGIAVVDGNGMSVSLIQSVFHAFGSGVLEPQTGVLLHNRGTSFSLDPDSPNVVAPGKRPLHTLMPIIVTEGGALRFVLATQGGQGQPQIHAQLLLRMLAGESPTEAVNAPRFIVGVRADGASAEATFVEPDVEPETMQSLRDSGLPLIVTQASSEHVGQANVIALSGGRVRAASDSRADGSGVVVTT